MAELTKEEACEKLASALVVFVQFAQVIYEEVDEMRDVLRTLCPGTEDFSRDLVASKKD